MSRLLIFLIAGVAGALIADKKGRDRLIWFLLCFFFPPLLLLLFLLPLKLTAGKTKQCPFCTRLISAKDDICRYCGKELPIEMVQCPGCGSFVPDRGYCIQCNRQLK